MNLKDSLELKRLQCQGIPEDSVHVTANKNAALELLLRMQSRYVSGTAEHVIADVTLESDVTTISRRSSNYG